MDQFEDIRPGSYIRTYNGEKFYPFNPRAEDMDVEVIAHALSNMCRYNGHTKYFYSVAQHSVLVSYLCDVSDAQWGLHHDDSEAYFGDIVNPIKRNPLIGPIVYPIEWKIQQCVAIKFGLSWPMPASVHYADKLALKMEMATLIPKSSFSGLPFPFRIEPLYPHEAEQLYLSRYEELSQ